MKHNLLLLLSLLIITIQARAVPKVYGKEQAIWLKEYVGREWTDELIHYDLQFKKGEIPKCELHMVNKAGRGWFQTPHKCSYYKVWLEEQGPVFARVGWGSANMPVNTRGGRAVSAAVLADDPDAKAWFDRAVEYVDAMVKTVWSEDGSSISAPHYVSTQADPLVNMALPLYYAGAIPPIQKKYPRIRNFTRKLIDRLTPPDRRINKERR